jgi:succinate-acetate transporter protein
MFANMIFGKGFFLLFMGILVFMFLICSLRTSIVFFLIFLCLDIGFFLLTAAYFRASKGDVTGFERLAVVSHPPSLLTFEGRKVLWM